MRGANLSQYVVLSFVNFFFKNALRDLSASGA